jgi:hypothetical protein
VSVAQANRVILADDDQRFLCRTLGHVQRPAELVVDLTGRGAHPDRVLSPGFDAQDLVLGPSLESRADVLVDAALGPFPFK